MDFLREAEPFWRSWDTDVKSSARHLVLVLVELAAAAHFLRLRPERHGLPDTQAVGGALEMLKPKEMQLFGHLTYHTCHVLKNYLVNPKAVFAELQECLCLTF